MAVNITGKYLGDLKMELTHGPSGTKLRTAAPVDNQGDGSSFSPTDLVAAALGSCYVTLIGIAGKQEGIDLEGLSFSAEKHMVADPRRIGAVPVRINMPAGLSSEQRATLERAARTCPVCKSLPPEVEREITFVYPD